MTGRILELLERHSYLDQQTIGEMAIIPAREARERLYCMYRDRWVDYIEVCKRSDYTPASTFYFWFLDKAKLENSLKESFYRSIFKLRCRRVHAASENESADLVDISVLHQMDNENEEAKRLEQMEFSFDRIDQAVVQTDFTSLIFDF